MDRDTTLAILRFMQTKGFNVRENKPLKDKIVAWLKTLDPAKMDFNDENLAERVTYGYFKFIGLGIMKDFLKENGYDDFAEFNTWLISLDPSLYLERFAHHEAYEAIVVDFLESLRVKNRKGYSRAKTEKLNLPKNTVYTDINKEHDSVYESKKMGMITTNNVNLGKVYVYFDSFFSNNTASYFTLQLGNKEQYTFNVKSLSYPLNNIKSLKISEVFLPIPNNILITNDDILKMNIEEVSLLTHREYPNINYIYQFKVDTSGSRLKLTPLNDYYQLTSYLSVLNSMTVSFWIQHKILTFNSVFKVGTLTSGLTTNINTLNHGLSTGDKIAIYDFAISDFVSVFNVSVTGPNDFNIPIDSTTMTLPSNIKYYITKNKVEFNLDITCL